MLDLLPAALPYQTGPHALAHCLGTIGRWIGYLPEPCADVQDTLYRYASTETEEIAEPALLGPVLV